jgi:[acyl-carrier-protein] S-malonyltransferase
MGKLAFVFSGQGSQYSGMGKELYESSAMAAEVFEKAEKLRNGTIDLCFSGTREQLSVTANTQPALFCVDLAAAMALKENGIAPDIAAGFSLGEIPALAFAGYLSFEQAFDFVCKRAQWMNECTEKNKGAMVAVIGIDAEKVESICSGVQSAYPVNFNTAIQTVVACLEYSLNELSDKLKASGAKVIKLSVSGAFHSPFMDKASEKIRELLNDTSFGTPIIPVISNVTAQIYDDKFLLARQVNSPVLWHKTILNMIDSGVDTFVEVGAGKTLCGIIKKINANVLTLNVEDKESLKNALEELNHA